MANGHNPQVAPTVLGSGTEPTQFLLRNRAFQAQQEARQQVLNQRKQASRDAAIGKLMEFQPDKAWAPYDKSIKSRANELRQWTVGQLSQGRDPHDPAFLAELAGRKDQVNTIASGSNHLKGEFNKQYNSIKENPYLEKESSYNALNNEIYNADGSPKDIEEIDYDRIRNITSDPSRFDMNAVGRDFVENLGENISKHYQEVGEQGKRHYDVEDITASTLLERNTKTGTWDIAVNEATIEVAKKDAYLGPALEQHKQQTGMGDEEALTDLLKDYVPDAQVKKSVGRFLPGQGEASDRSRKQQEKVEQADTRYQLVRDAVWNADASALAEASDLTEDVSVNYGNVLPGERYPESITVRVRTGKTQTGKPVYSTETLSLKTDDDRERAESIINKLVDKSQRSATGQTIGSDDFREARKRFKKGQVGQLYDREPSIVDNTTKQPY